MSAVRRRPSGSVIYFTQNQTTLFMYRDGTVKECLLADDRAVLLLAQEAIALINGRTHYVNHESALCMSVLLDRVCKRANE